jgi:hypothetical protein
MLVGMVGLLGRSRAVAMGKGPVDNNALRCSILALFAYRINSLQLQDNVQAFKKASVDAKALPLERSNWWY